MAEEMGGDLGSMMMGNVSEEASESSEQIQARIAAAKAKMAKIKKEEKKDTGFDQHLSKILRDLTPEQLDFVIFLIDNEVTSLTILAIFSLVNDEAGKICFVEFEKYIESRADFSNVNLPSVLQDKISYWWTFIYGADHVSTTTKLKEFKLRHKFKSQFATGLESLLKDFLEKNKIEDFDVSNLKMILDKYRDMIFKDEKG